MSFLNPVLHPNSAIVGVDFGSFITFFNVCTWRSSNTIASIRAKCSNNGNGKRHLGLSPYYGKPLCGMTQLIYYHVE